MLQWTSPSSGTSQAAQWTSPSSDTSQAAHHASSRTCDVSNTHPSSSTHASRVLRVLESLNADALARQGQRAQFVGGGGGDGMACMSEGSEGLVEGDEACEEDLSSCKDSGSEGEAEGGLPCCWQELHELHVDVVQVCACVCVS